MTIKEIFKVPTSSFHTGMAGNRLLELCFLRPRVTAAVYQGFLSNVLPELLHDVDLQTRIHLLFMHGGAPVREFVHNVLPEQWTGRGGPTAWPPCFLG
jgi:hypothetical protein